MFRLQISLRNKFLESTPRVLIADGKQGIRIRHNVEVVLQKNIWPISQFHNLVMKP
jgi:ureidoglycolate hydrolase